jgi:hypothetical protein
MFVTAFATATPVGPIVVGADLEVHGGDDNRLPGRRRYERSCTSEPAHQVELAVIRSVRVG